MTATARIWTEDQANAALVYLRPIVEQAMGIYRDAMDMRARIRWCPDGRHRDELKGEYETMMDRLTALTDDVDRTGASLQNYRTGSIMFPAACDGYWGVVWNPSMGDTIRWPK